MNNRLRDAKELIRSKVYILITDKEAKMAGDFKGFDGLMKINSLKLMLENGERLIKKIGASSPAKGSGSTKRKEVKRGGNTSGRKKSSPAKQGKVRS